MITFLSFFSFLIRADDREDDSPYSFSLGGSDRILSPLGRGRRRRSFFFYHRRGGSLPLPNPCQKTCKRPLPPSFPFLFSFSPPSCLNLRNMGIMLPIFPLLLPLTNFRGTKQKRDKCPAPFFFFSLCIPQEEAAS